MTEYGRIHTDGSRSGGQPIVKTQHCPNCETNAREAERWRVRAERWRVRADQHNDECERMGIKGQAIIDQLSAENERLREAVDLLGVALAEHGHTWTVEERTAYEKAIRTPVGESK